MTRFFDILIAIIGLIILSPLLLVIILVILLDPPGGVFFRQTRVGRNNRDFRMWKFRTMRPGSDRKGSLTIGAADSRITRSGAFLRRYKLDELPQIFNVISGEMSLVGPRPEVRKYVDLYSERQKQVLSIRPGITDYASIQYMDENELLGNSTDPEKTYITEVMPAKLELNLIYLKNPGIRSYFTVIGKTVSRILLVAYGKPVRAR
ncbi:MAG: sugar transferase [Bacteroidetes bacterium]|nr:sugar transferase [Bacteroidota bacterium]